MLTPTQKRLLTVALGTSVVLSSGAATADAVAQSVSSESPSSTSSSTPSSQSSSQSSSSTHTSPSSPRDSDRKEEFSAKIVTDDVDKTVLGISYSGLDTRTIYKVSVSMMKDGNTVGETQDFEIKTMRGYGSVKYTLKNAVRGATVHISVTDDIGQKITDINGSTQGELVVNNVDNGENTPVQIRTSAQLDTDVIQTGSTVSDTVSYDHLVAGQQYTIKTTLVCSQDALPTGKEVETQFTPEKSQGEMTVENIAITDPDCLEQVVFEKIFDAQGNLVATHEDINDKAQTVGGERDGKKKKKKDGDNYVSSPTSTPAQEPAAPQPLGVSPDNAPRASIGSIPSGSFSGFGYTLFS